MSTNNKRRSVKEPRLVRITISPKAFSGPDVAYSRISASALIGYINDCSLVGPFTRNPPGRRLELLKRCFLNEQFVNPSVILNKRSFNKSTDLIKCREEVFLDLSRGGLDVIDNQTLVKALQIACNEKPSLGNALYVECTIGLGWEIDQELRIKQQINGIYDLVRQGVCDGGF